MSFFRVAIFTLGCKLNQLESESIANAFKREGFSQVPAGEAADIYVVNTCTVTSKAEQKARRYMRNALRGNPEAVVVATGCYAQLDPEAVAAVAESVDHAMDRTLSDRRRVVVVQGDLKAALMDLPAYLADRGCSVADLPEVLFDWSRGIHRDDKDATDRFRFDPENFVFHSRASLKIQDGCDCSCTYCRVRLARGRSVSLDPALVLQRLQALELRGYGEAILTGINLSRYRSRSGEGSAMDFPDLLRFLLAGTSHIALRISSTEPDSVDERFAEAVADPRVRPHFHLAVQSGSDAVLSRMRRPYKSAVVRRAAALLRGAKDDPFLACDMITGFPGETDEDFLLTRELCAELDFAWIHAFPFSPRPGTEAASYSHKVPERVSVERVSVLSSLSKAGRAAYVSRWVGRNVVAIVEGAPSLLAESDQPWFPAVSENYLKLRVRVPFDSEVLTKFRVKTQFYCTLKELDESGLEESRGEPPFDAIAQPLGL